MNKKQKELENKKSEIIKYYNENEKSINEISLLAGCSTKTLLKFLKKNSTLLEIRTKVRPKNCLNVNKDYFKEINTAEKAYWLGFLYADGHISYNKNGTLKGLQFRLIDDHPIYDFKKAIGSEHKISKKIRLCPIYNKTRISYGIIVSHKEFAKNICNLGLTGKNNYQTQFPNIKEEFYSHFIRGLFDGDGCIIPAGKYNRQLNFIVTESIYFHIKDFFSKRLGVEITKHKNIATNSSGNIVTFYIHKVENVVKLLDFIYTNSTKETRLYRKYIIADSFIKYWNNKQNSKKIYIFKKDATIIETKNITKFARENGLRKCCMFEIIKEPHRTHKNWSFVGIK